MAGNHPVSWKSVLLIFEQCPCSPSRSPLNPFYFQDSEVSLEDKPPETHLTIDEPSDRVAAPAVLLIQPATIVDSHAAEQIQRSYE